MKVVYNNKAVANYDLVCTSVKVRCNLKTLIIAYELSICITVAGTFRRY